MHSLSIFLSFLLAQAIASPLHVLGRAESQGDPLIEDFAWSEVAEVTGVDPSQYLASPAKASDGTFSCTTEPGPDRIGCGDSIASWATMGDENNRLHIPAKSCSSITQNCCRTVVCATKEDLDVSLDEATGRMWNPLMIRCVLPGKGGAWQASDGNMVVQVGYPGKGGCETNGQ